jgi:hypothetical protein
MISEKSLNFFADVLYDIVSDRINYPKNFKAYKRDKKLNDFWHLVPEET